MSSILEQLYSGEIYPAEQWVPRGKEYQEACRKNQEHYNEFIELLSKLNPPLDKRFGEIMDERVGVMSYELDDMFVYGFRLGARMMAEVFICE